MDRNHKNETTGEEEMVGIGLFLEDDIKQEPTYHPEIESDISYFSVNNDPLDIKSEDFLISEHVSKNKDKRPDVDFFGNNDPLNIKSEDVDVVVENGLSNVTKTTKSTKYNMLGEIVEAIGGIKQENDRVLMEGNSAATPASVTSDEKPKCEICGFTFATQHGLKKHAIVHKNPSEIFMYKCTKCPFESKHKTYLKSHILNVHGSPSQLKKFSCEMCNYKTNYRFSFKKHLVLHHTPLKTEKKEKQVYKCESCEYTTKKKALFVKHSRVHKTPSELTMDKCPLCPYQSKHQSGVANHMLCHKSSSETPMFKCELCTYETKWRHCLRNHLKAHENKCEYPTIRKCGTCEFITNNIYSLEIHMKSHTVPCKKPKETFTCFTCGFQAKEKRRLVRHMSRHNPLWQEYFVCAMCGVRTKSKRTLRNHVLIIHGPMANIEIKPNF